MFSWLQACWNSDSSLLLLLLLCIHVFLLLRTISDTCVLDVGYDQDEHSKRLVYYKVFIVHLHIERLVSMHRVRMLKRLPSNVAVNSCHIILYSSSVKKKNTKLHSWQSYGVKMSEHIRALGMKYYILKYNSTFMHRHLKISHCQYQVPWYLVSVRFQSHVLINSDISQQCTFW